MTNIMKIFKWSWCKCAKNSLLFKSFLGWQRLFLAVTLLSSNSRHHPHPQKVNAECQDRNWKVFVKFCLIKTFWCILWSSVYHYLASPVTTPHPQKVKAEFQEWLESFHQKVISWNILMYTLDITPPTESWYCQSTMKIGKFSWELLKI